MKLLLLIRALSPGEREYPRIPEWGRVVKDTAYFQTGDLLPSPLVLPTSSRAGAQGSLSSAPRGCGSFKGGGGGGRAVLSVSALRTQPSRSRCRPASPSVSANESPPGSGGAPAVGGVGRWPATNPGWTAKPTEEGPGPRREGPRRRSPQESPFLDLWHPLVPGTKPGRAPDPARPAPGEPAPAPRPARAMLPRGSR